MSRLHNPGPGEILDRLTILALKITYGTFDKVPITHWVEEQAALERLLETGYTESGWKPSTCGTTFALASVNAALWAAEDDLRDIRSLASDHPLNSIEAGHLGMQIQKLNDRRAELVSLINTNAGVDRPSEKL